VYDISLGRETPADLFFQVVQYLVEVSLSLPSRAFSGADASSGNINCRHSFLEVFQTAIINRI